MILFSISLTTLVCIHGIFITLSKDPQLSAKMRIRCVFFTLLMVIAALLSFGITIAFAVDPIIGLLRYLTGSPFRMRILADAPAAIGGALICAYAVKLSIIGYRLAKQSS